MKISISRKVFVFCKGAGAKNTIQKLKPKIAISVYHKTADLWEIPLKVLEINPDYKFYLRHHSHDVYDTVLYTGIDPKVKKISF